MSLRHKFWGLGLIIAISTFQAKAADKSSFEFYGFAQLDYIQDFQRVDPNWEDALRPSKIPAHAGQYGSDGQAILGVRQSRFGVQSSLPIDEQTLYTRLEFDLWGMGADEGKTTPRLRHAYGQWGDWLGGKTDSVFMDVGIFPLVIDFWGPTGMAFTRNPQIRWMPLQGDTAVAVAIEKPSADIDRGDVTDNLQADKKVPDLTAHLRKSGGWGHVQLAGLLRQIGYEASGVGNHSPSEQKTGWGLNLTSRLFVMEKDQLLLGVVSGEGIASYMNDGGNDIGFDGTVANYSAKALPLIAYSAYYNHSWNDKWSTALGLSQTEVENADLQKADAYKRGQYASINLLATPHKNMLTGAEFLWGSRKSNDGTLNEDTRIQVSMKYYFSSKDL